MARAQKGQQLRGGSRRLGLAAGPGRAVRGPGQAGRAARCCSRACRASRMTRWRRDGQCTRRCRLSWTPRSRAPASTRRWPTFPAAAAPHRAAARTGHPRVARYSSGLHAGPAGSRGPAPGAGARAARGTAQAGRGARRATPRLAPRHRAGNGAAPGEAGDLAILRARLNGLHAGIARGRRGLAQRPHAAGAVRLPAACDARRKPHRPAVGAGRPGGAADADLVAVHPDGHALHPGDGCADLLAAGRDNLDHVPADRVPQQHRVCVRARPAELPGRDA